MSLPSNKIRPLVGVVRRSANRATVVFPEPDSPTNASVFPLPMLRLTTSTARRLWWPAPGTAKSLVRFSASRMGGAADGASGSAVRDAGELTTRWTGNTGAALRNDDDVARRLGAAAIRDFV